MALIDPIWQFCNRSLKRALSRRLAPAERNSRKALAGRKKKPSIVKITREEAMRRMILALVCAAAPAICGGPAAAQQEITLTVAAGQPLRAMNPLNLVSEFFIPEVNKRIEAAGLDIKINWKEAYAGSLLKPTFVLQGVSDGIADIGFEPTIFHPDKLPLEQVSFMTPFTTTDVGAGRQARSTSCMRRFPNSPRSTTSSASSGSAGATFNSYELFTTVPVAEVQGHRTARRSPPPALRCNGSAARARRPSRAT